MNLIDFFLPWYSPARRSWRQLYVFLEGLPPWGQYKTSMAMDEEWARRICDMQDEQEETPPTGEPEESDDLSPLYYDPVVARLDLIADRTMAIRTAVQAGYSKDHKEPGFQTLQRPSTALQRERERRNIAILEETDILFRTIGFSVLAEE